MNRLANPTSSVVPYATWTEVPKPVVRKEYVFVADRALSALGRCAPCLKPLGKSINGTMPSFAVWFHASPPRRFADSILRGASQVVRVTDSNRQ